VLVFWCKLFLIAHLVLIAAKASAGMTFTRSTRLLQVVGFIGGMPVGCRDWSSYR
jgi:hypothetical protein